jgi:hypothetical protein
MARLARLQLAGWLVKKVRWHKDQKTTYWHPKIHRIIEQYGEVKPERERPAPVEVEPLADDNPVPPDQPPGNEQAEHIRGRLLADEHIRRFIPAEQVENWVERLSRCLADGDERRLEQVVVEINRARRSSRNCDPFELSEPLPPWFEIDGAWLRTARA